MEERYGGQKKRGQIVVILPRRDTKVKKQASIDANISDILHGFRKSPMGGKCRKYLSVELEIKPEPLTMSYPLNVTLLLFSVKDNGGGTLHTLSF